MSSAAKMRIHARDVLLAVATAIALQPDALAQGQRQVTSSLLLLIDASGSMGDAISGGNAEVKINAAKRAASAALSRAASGGSVEVAVLAFSGDCQNPVPRYQDFTRDVDQLARFIGSLQPGGGTPMADALLFANRYLAGNGNAGAADRMIMLLADGQNDCGDIGQTMAALKASGVIFRHETVGFRHHARLAGGPGPAPDRDPDRRDLSPCRRRQPARGRVHGVRGHAERDRHTRKVRRREIATACGRLAALSARGGNNCRCPPGLGGPGYSEDSSSIDRERERTKRATGKATRRG